ncbi:ATP-dependent DNA helicase pif1 [Stylophora pistillata]|uniref:ATP-dependent DNA helicase n=1 Tax=Stylophora pistillata TaxID=50429 RepID=A0A2B4RU55_STYPI|nr:ATP-dependent DNA helicase pif1 [Stylophora pistillata]
MIEIENMDDNCKEIYTSGLLKLYYDLVIPSADRNTEPLLMNELQELKVLMLAPTGKAAYNVKGNTIHSASAIPACQSLKIYKLLNLSRLKTVRCKLQGVKLLFIDKISMVGNTVFNAQINSRLKDIKGSSQTFGGVSIVAIWDLFQPQPVMGGYIFKHVEKDEYGKPSGLMWVQCHLAEVGEKTRHDNRQLYDEGIEPTWTPMKPVSTQFAVGRNRSEQVLRKQFQGRPAAAKMIHRSQDLQLEGYVRALSPVKAACNSRKPYFSCLNQTNQDKKVRVVCFNPPKKVNLPQAYSQKSPVKVGGIKRSSSTRFSNNQDQYQILKQAKMLPTLTHSEYNAKIGSSLLTVEQALSADLYKNIDVPAKVMSKHQNKQPILRNGKKNC